jgi:hypothetical protein
MIKSPKNIPSDLHPVDDEIDRVWGEPVVLKPMIKQSGGYRGAVPDPSRVEVIARGIYDQSRGAVEGFGAAGTSTRQATVDTTLSIRWEPVAQAKLKKDDRVFFPERDETYDVTFIHDDPGGRPDVHLVRVLE